MALTNAKLFEFLTCLQWIALLLPWLCLIVPLEAQNQNAEVQALLSFKAQALGSLSDYAWSFEIDGYWDTWNPNDENACAWVGVTCTPNFTVAELHLSGWTFLAARSQLDDIFNKLSPLTDLRGLDFSHTYPYHIPDIMPGLLPSDLGNLRGLTHVDFSGNGFSGDIPFNISALQNLRFLSLEQNMLSGEIPSFRGLQNLQVLLLGGNNFSGAFPRELGELSSLVMLDLSYNMLNGTIPSLANSTNLRKLKVDNNYFTGFEEPFFPNTTTLEHVDVSANQMEGVIPPGFANMTYLEYFNVSCNRLSGQIPAGLHSHLLDLSYNQLSGNLPADFLYPYSFDSIETSWINVSHNLISGSIPGNIPLRLDGPGADHTYLLSLDLRHNNLTGNISSIITHHNNNTVITSLLVDDNHLSGDIVEMLVDLEIFGGSLNRFSDLSFGNNLFTGDLTRLASVVDWERFISLNFLDISNNKLHCSTSAAIPDPLRILLERLPSGVHEVRLNGNNFSGAFLPGTSPLIPDHKNLTDVYYPPPSKSGPKSGLILRVLDLRNCHLGGEISSAIFNSKWFPELRILDLSKNDIAGPVPEDIILLPEMTILDLSNNNLSGPLPPISPTSNVYNNSFFAGNSGLCGPPLTACPVPTPAPTSSRKESLGISWWWLLLIIGGSLTITGGTCLIATWRWTVCCKKRQQDADLIKTLLERESATLMSLRELKKATNDFAQSAQIGQGGFGTVYKGILNNGTVVAIKRSKHEGSQKNKEVFLNEVRILSQVNHHFLVKLLGCCMENEVALLVFEFVPNGTLRQHLQGEIRATRLSWKQRLDIAVQTADALNYLHTAATFAIYHRDVKSANILLDNELNAKVADFGISKLAPGQTSHISTIADGTPGYIDPEYYASCRLTDKSDVYSFGVVLLELISAKAAIDFNRGEAETSLVNHAIPIIEGGDLGQLIDPALVDTFNDTSSREKDSIWNVASLALKCLDSRSRNRPNINEVWKQLQDLQLELNGACKHFTGSSSTSGHKDDLKDFHDTIKHLDSMIEAANEDPKRDHVVSPISEPFLNSTLDGLEDGSFIELAQFSR